MTLKPSELWEMSPGDFNKWRRENDLKKLFDVFRKHLPHFEEWLQNNHLEVDFILETDNPGHFFIGQAILIALRQQQIMVL